jgi:hypothetical protein
VKFLSRNGLVAVHIKEEESLGETVELLLNFDSDQGHDL